MERVILRHLKGSKSGTQEEFPLASVSELTLGRDPMAQVRFDAEKDDLVGRQHARVVKDPNDPTRFSVADLNSRNGTFLNKLRVVGSMPLMPGDVIQLGAGGPEVQFDLDPLPAAYVKATRLGGVGVAGATAQAAETRAGTPVSATVGAAPAPNAIGKATVERMIGHTRKEGRRNTMIAIAIGLLVITGVAAYAKSQSDLTEEEARTRDSLAALKTDSLGQALARPAALGAMMTPAEIAEKYAGAVIQVDFSWNLIYAPTGAQVYHRYVPNSALVNGRRVTLIPGAPAWIPAYVSVGDNTIEPDLTLDAIESQPIAVTSGGSGFVVTSDGFILTNRHVAANWRTYYRFNPDELGVLMEGNVVLLDAQNRPITVRPPNRWIPSETKQTGPKGEFDVFRGRQEYLMVRFRKNTTPLEATIQRVSDNHDVALIKIASVGAVPKVELFDSYEATKVGDQVIVMGYPSISDAVVAVLRSKDMFNRDAQTRIVPDPTVSVGNIGKILRAADGPTSSLSFTFAPSGDTYQLTINSTGGGNSGGPMFDASGRVIGIYFAGKVLDAQISFAVPIRYGMDLMSVAPNSP